MQPTTLPSKPHYLILDALRGVAAVMVVIFHIFEAHSKGPLFQIINHGYLAVDFFFLLSGFVVGYAYDDRWNTMTLGNFFKRRLIRLQPMVVMGSLVGAALFYFQQSTVLFPMIGQVPVWKMLLLMLVGSCMIPIPPAMDIRGWQETYPLNGPAWSLFFEYIANILYALGVKKFSNKALAVVVIAAAVALVHLTVTGSGDVIGGWSLELKQLRIGFTRLLYPFFAGLLLSRLIKPGQFKNAFLCCSLLLVAVLSLPRFGGAEHLWVNGLYDSLAIIIVFPLIVYAGACGEIKSSRQTKLATLLGDISYPIYITHYPIIYIYTAWVVNNKPNFQQAFPFALLTLFSAIVLAYACLKLYDEPVRRWLQQRFLRKHV